MLVPRSPGPLAPRHLTNVNATIFSAQNAPGEKAIGCRNEHRKRALGEDFIIQRVQFLSFKPYIASGFFSLNFDNRSYFEIYFSKH